MKKSSFFLQREEERRLAEIERQRLEEEEAQRKIQVRSLQVHEDLQIFMIFQSLHF